LNFVKVHDADDLLSFVLNFLVVVSYKLGDDHTTASQEFFDCITLFHFLLLAYCATGTPLPSPLDLPTICPLLSPFPLDERAEWPVVCTTDWPGPV
jgi:hypothetical protein